MTPDPTNATAPHCHRALYTSAATLPDGTERWIDTCRCDAVRTRDVAPGGDAPVETSEWRHREAGAVS